eukprot:526530_1
MTETLRMIDHIDSKTRCIVFGFIRSIQILLAKDINVPSEIVCMCLLYYYNPEYFTTFGSHITLLENGTVAKYNITGSTVEGNTVYGNVEINQNDYIKCVWTFKIVKLLKYPTIAVGITSAKTNVNDIFHTDYWDRETAMEWNDTLDPEEENSNVEQYANAYAYSMYGDTHTGMITHALVDDERAYEYSDDYYGCVWKECDELKMELNVQNRTLKYYVNAKDQGIAVQNVKFRENTTFVMAISVNTPAEIKLINFKAIYTKS